MAEIYIRTIKTRTPVVVKTAGIRLGRLKYVGTIDMSGTAEICWDSISLSGTAEICWNN
jgi:hypothetical protein